MKKITLVLFCVVVAISAHAQQWVETFGPDDVVKNASGYWPYVSGSAENYVYTNYDHVSDCVYEGSSASVRKVNPSTITAGIGNHVWLSAPKPENPPTYPEPTLSWLKISGINRSVSYLSFDLAPSSDGYVPNIKLFINDQEVVLPSITLSTTNVMQTIRVPVSRVVNSLKIQNFDAATGIRVDNIKLDFPTVSQSNIFYEIDSINARAIVMGGEQNIISASIASTITYNSVTYPVVAIAPFAFATQTNLTSVTIPSSITNIGSSAFYNCSGLTSVIIPSSVTNLGSSAFFGTGLTSIVLPSLITSISDNTFSHCSNLSSVILPNSLTSIGVSAFSNCSSLTSIAIPSGVTNIGSNAFSGTGLTSLVFNAVNCPTASFDYLLFLNSVTIGSDVIVIPANFIFGCSNVTSVTIPSSVTRIGTNAFSGIGLTSLVFNAINCPIISFNDISTLNSVTIGSGVTVIPANFVSGCSNVTSITIPSTVTSIGSSAFSGTGLTSVVIPPSVTEISNNTFSNCSSLSSVTIPNSIATIGSSAFSNCSSLTSITIPTSVTHIENWVFDGCTALTTFTCEGNPQLDFDDSDGEYSSVLSFIPNLDSVVGPASMFDIPELGWVRLPKKIRHIKVIGGDLTNDAFVVINRSYKTLKSLDLAAATNTQLADEAFKDCYSLETLVLPSALERIGYMAVANCKNLKSVNVPASVTDIDDSAFENCRSMTSLTFGDQVDKSRQRSVSSNSKLQRIGNWSFYNCHNLQSLTIPEGVTEIGSAAFYGCTYLSDLTLPSSLQQIGDNCFALCSKLNYITVNAMMPPTIEAKTFADVNRTIPLYVPAGSLQAYQSDIYWSEFMNVTEAPTAIKPVTIIEGVYAQNGNIVIENDTNLPVAIYDVVGRLVASGSSLTQQFAVPNAGLYLVKVGNQTMKVLVP